MMDNELLLFDRINIIKDTILNHGMNNFYISFSGGKDSTILHYLVDLALPDNDIPRVYVDTGVEYNLIRDFVYSLSLKDKRFVIIQPFNPVIPLLKKYGYPFKSKEYSKKLYLYKKGLRSPSIIRYFTGNGFYDSPFALRYQLNDEFKLNISHFCCDKLKKEPLLRWESASGRLIAITGLRNSEGGQRGNLKHCVITDSNGKIKRFHPLLVCNESFESYFIAKYNIDLCKLYYPPYNFKRTGCKGCPFNLRLKNDLKVMKDFLPKEYAQCETIWKPVYDEYRKIGYRL